MDKKKQASDYASKTIHLSHGEDIDDEALVHNIRFMAFLAGWDACEQDRDRLKKQNEVYRKALKKIMNDQRSIHEPAVTSSVWVSSSFKVAHDALKAAEDWK